MDNIRFSFYSNLVVFWMNLTKNFDLKWQEKIKHTKI